MTLAERITAIPGDGGWWCKNSEEVFLSAAKALVFRGFTEEESVVFLTRLINAVRDEYGD